MKKNVLDASAILALLHREPGHEEVAKFLPNSIVSAVNVAEAMSVLINYNMPADKAEEAILSILEEIIPFDLKQAIMTSKLRKETKTQGLSLGDRACLSLAKLNNIPAVTADNVWNKLKLDVDIHFIR